MFTRDPLADPTDDSNSSTMLVTASADSGVSVVEGRGGESYYIDRRDGRLEREGPEPTDAGPLEDVEIAEFATRARRIEQAFGAGWDVEWAIGRVPGFDERERCYLLQARPITAGAAGGEGPRSVWTNANVGEALPGVATPLTWSIIGKFSRRGFERAFGTLGLDVPEDYELVGSFRGRVYLNLTQFISIASTIPILDPDVLFEMAGGGGADLVREVHPTQSRLGFLARLPVTAARVLGAQLTMPLVAPIWSAYMDRRVDAFFERDLSEMTLGGLASELERIDRIFDRNGLIMLTCSSNFLMSYVVMKKFLDWFGRPEARRRERELFGALDVQSAEPVLDLLELTRRAGESGRVGAILREHQPGEVADKLERAAAEGEEAAGAFLEELSEFCREHGHRAPREAELATPRWREERRFIFEIIQSYLQAPEMPTPESYRREWRADRQRVGAIVEEGFGRVAGRLFGGLLGWARSTARIREFMRTHVVETLDLYRRFALECGRRLAARGLISRAEDVFYLRYDEIRVWLEGEVGGQGVVQAFSLRVAVRRAMVDALRDLPDPPNTFVLRDGDIVDAEEVRRGGGPSVDRPDEVRHILEGLAGMRGKVTGRARVIEDPEAGQTVEPGEILVAPYTDVGWTPLFLTASAIVMGLGGPLSHACIVAREFGIPTVVNARGATDKIATGDLVTVDGDAGIVYVHQEREAGEDEEHAGESPTGTSD
jgi:pyruvate,water dikinase